MSAKYAIVTGGNAGIGLETVKELAKKVYYITFTARSVEKGDEAKLVVQAEVPGAQLDCLVMELADLSTVKSAAQEYVASGKPLHLLINNAGIMNVPYQLTVDGYESHFQVNHLGHFLFTHHLLPVMRRSGGGRVVNVSSRAHMRWNQPLNVNTMATAQGETYDGMTVYGRSKICNIYFSAYLAKKFPFEESHIAFNSLHPGLVDTKLLNTFKGLSASAIPVSEGCRNSIHVATAPEIEGVSGEYFHECAVANNPSFISSNAQSASEAAKLWELSLKLTGIKDEDYGM